MQLKCSIQENRFIYLGAIEDSGNGDPTMQIQTYRTGDVSDKNARLNFLRWHEIHKLRDYLSQQIENYQSKGEPKMPRQNYTVEQLRYDLNMIAKDTSFVIPSDCTFFLYGNLCDIIAENESMKVESEALIARSNDLHEKNKRVKKQNDTLDVLSNNLQAKNEQWFYECADLRNAIEKLQADKGKLHDKIEKLGYEGQRDLDMMLDLCKLIPGNDSGESPELQIKRAAKFIKAAIAANRASGIYKVKFIRTGGIEYAKYDAREKKYYCFGEVTPYKDTDLEVLSSTELDLGIE